MNLIELQNELHRIAKKVAELETAVGQMEIQPKFQNDSTNEFESITKLAVSHPLERGLCERSQNTKKVYIKLLAHIALMDEKCMREKLLYITRIAAGIDSHEYTAELVAEMGLRLRTTDMESMAQTLKPVSYAFLVDAFVVSNICGQADRAVQSVLGGLSEILECNMKEIKVVSTVAKSVLTADNRFLERIKGDTNYMICIKFQYFIPKQQYAEWCKEYKDREFESVFLGNI